MAGRAAHNSRHGYFPFIPEFSAGTGLSVLENPMLRFPARRIQRARRLARLAALLLLCAAAASAGAQTNFGRVNVGSSAQSTVTMTLPQADSLGSIAVVTQGAAGMDFTNAGTGTCQTGVVYSAGQTCTVDVAFKPAYPGMRYGAALLKDQSGNVIAMAGLAGVGVGPQLEFATAASIAMEPLVDGARLKVPFDVAVDGTGNLFMTDTVNARVVEIPAGGGAPTSIDPIVDGDDLDTPGGVIVDGSGNLYISDLDNNNIVKVPADGSAAVNLNPAPNGLALNYPCGMAFDAAGDLYIADVDNSRVVEMPAGGAAPIAIDPVVNGKGLIYPVAVALDTAGNLYIADEFGNQVVEVPAGGGAATAIKPSVNGQKLYWPYGIVVDAAGDLFIADADNRVIEVPAGGGAATAITPTVDGQGLNDPIGIALDGAGNLFIADSLNNRVVEVERSQQPAPGFAATAVGTASADSPQTITIENDGNAPLEFPVPASGTNPTISANFTLGSGGATDCPQVTAGSLSGGTLAAGASCTLPVSFQPAAGGSIYGALTLADNNLNASGPGYAQQSVPLSGAAPMAALSAPALWFGAQTVSAASPAQQVTITNNGGAPLAIGGITVTGSGAAGYSFPNTCGASIAAGASCTLKGVLTPAATGALNATLSIADNAANSPQTVALSGAGVYLPLVSVMPSASSVSTAQALTVTVGVGQVGSAPAPTGTVIVDIEDYLYPPVALSGGSATVTIPAGTVVVGPASIVVKYEPDAASSTVYAVAWGTGQLTVTQALAPTAAAGTASSVTTSSASLSAAVNPNGADTHAWFVYGTSSTLSGASQTASQDIGSGSAATNVTANLSGLSAGTTYYFQVAAQNSVGTSSGAIGTFTTALPPTFTMAGTAISLAPGATTGNTSSITITPANGFTGTVNLSCSISPAAASDPPTCSVPASVNITGAAAQSVTLTVNTTAAVALNGQELWPAGGAVLACILLLPFRRRGRLLLLMLCVAAMAGAISACGGGSGNSVPPNPGTTPGTYAVTVTGSSGSITATAPVTLTVQ